MIQEQSLAGSKHFLVETADKNLADPAVHVHPEHGYGHPKGHRKADADPDADPPVAHPGHGHGHRKADAKLPYAKLRSPLDKTGDDYKVTSFKKWCRRGGRWRLCNRNRNRNRNRTFNRNRNRWGWGK